MAVTRRHRCCTLPECVWWAFAADRRARPGGWIV